MAVPTLDGTSKARFAAYVDHFASALGHAARTFAPDQQGGHLPGIDRLAMHRPEPADAEQPGDALGALAVD